MFGSKLRSWMENHIVRPRKKGNKNKTGNSGNNYGVLTAQNGYKSGTFTGDSTIGSPARRSEVSPIQNHTTSRRGWHSPNQDNVPISPKSDHFPIQHRIANSGQQPNGGGAQYWMSTCANGATQSSNSQQQHHAFSSPKSISRNGSSYTLESGRPPANVYYSKSVDSFADGGPMPYGMPDFDFHSASTGPSSVMTGASSTVGHQSHGHLAVNGTGHGNYSPATSSSNELLEDLHSLDASHHRIKRLHPATARISSSSSSSVASGNHSNQHHHQYHHGNNNFAATTAGNNNNNHMLNGALAHYHQHQQHHHPKPPSNGESKHGKVLHQPQYGGGPYYDQHHQQQQQQHNHLQHNGINNNPVYPIPPNSPPVPAAVTSVNGCSGAAGGSKPTASPLTPRNRIINGNNNNNNNNVHFDVAGKGAGGTGTGSSLTSTFASKFHKLTGARSDGGSKLNHVNNNNTNSSSSSGNSTTAHPPPPPPGNTANGPSYQHPHQPNQINNVTTHLHPPAPAPPVSSSPSPPQPPTAAGAGAHHLLHHPSATHHHHHPHGTAHPMGHTLSSPESAYSTGYSTDGTSPGGCSYTPEYYINIRTGTHYFPKGTTLPGALHGRAVDRTGTGPAANHGDAKFKCALNRIEEKHVEFCVDADKHVSAPRTNNGIPSVASASSATPAAATTTTHLSSFKPAAGAGALSQPQQPSSTAVATSQPPNAVAMSPVMQKNLGMQHYRSIESPSPRQRCRIRTNPWLTTADGVLASNCLKRTEQDSGSTSSGIKSSSGTDDNKNDNTKPNALSDTDSSSSTEKIVNKKILTPRSLKKACDIARLDSKSAPVTIGSNQDSDEDATLNEMMGKFDESYHYEKETDILSCSDSDPTDCPTDIDTGQDAGDECDTDDLLDLDFIDTGSVQEVPDKEIYRHTASCSIHQFPERIPSCKQRSMRTKRSNENGGGSRRRKKLVRTRKKPADVSTMGAGSGADSSTVAGGRGCRSLGGTPVSLRRNQPDSDQRTPAKGSPLTNRCNSLTFTEVHTLHSRILAISESEKALLKADLEADVKYKQLIHEAESILFSMKSNSSICIKELTGGPPPLPPREPQPQPPPLPPPSKDATTIASPRRVCNPPANKRVEMLRNCEADLRRELAKTCSQKCPELADLNPAEGVIVNKRLEVLRYETSCSLSAPNSPKNTRVLLPRKTHVSNFMSHHQSRPGRDPSAPESAAADLKQSANRASPPPPPPRLVSKSPTIMRRRFRSQSPHLNIESDSDSDDVSRNLDCKSNGKQHRSGGGGGSGNKENLAKHAQASSMRTQQTPPPPPPRREVAGKQMNNFRHTIHGPSAPTVNGEDAINGHEGGPPQHLPLALNGHGGMHKSPLISFRSVDIGSPVTDDSYCPQSEPLKRKIYTCSSAFEKIQRSLDHDADAKQQLIMDTLAEIKRSLEDQSVELNELNDSDN
ncbi:uncharacterized protein LOC131281332 [Anopheles ziemanni]|uniref:uncharacterized protein LOC131265400 n=1 Tax=Anopheles coustani TaxID=139045 RepID=UPI00265B65FB|nr:uncharacterized protein LOC131265400 [Anopheles coustani]XP_058166641.1 uncharacterized protein LOC131281332 [Anopheles ziemanni]